MKKLTRAGVLVLALALCLSLAACGGGESKTIDINALAEELVNAATFGEPMNSLDSSVALGLYGCAEGTSVCAYAGTGATAEEVAVFDCGSSDAAAALVSSLTQRNETRISQYSSYNPTEVPKLESAVIMQGGQYVVLIVAADNSAARTIAENQLG